MVSKNAVIFSVLAASLAIITILIVFDINSENAVKNIKELLDSKENSPSTSPSSLNQQQNNELSEGGGDRDTSGSVGGSSGSITPKYCYKRQISYIIANFYSNDSCVEYNGDICTKKDLICEFSLINNDELTSGTFSLSIFFMEEGKYIEDAFQTFQQSVNLNPHESKIVSITSSVLGDMANKEIYCFYQTTSVPKREICI